nr:MAG TPA: hypothetical protein [Caudoviricetes sp.]
MKAIFKHCYCVTFVTYFFYDILCCHNRISFNCYYFVFDDANVMIIIIQAINKCIICMIIIIY